MISRKLGLALAVRPGRRLFDGPALSCQEGIDRQDRRAAARGLADGLTANIIQGPLSQLAQTVRGAMQQVPADKREATVKALDSEFKKFVEENQAYLKDKINKAVPTTASALLDERFNEDELKQILAWAESPVSQKFVSPIPSCRRPSRRR